MRGAPADDRTGAVRLAGIIPADAGSTRCIMRQIMLSQDHPRGCGEHKISCAIVPYMPGSSPRMRGALLSRNSSAQRKGIIPADAGSTSASFFAWRGVWDHPRGCGEHNGMYSSILRDEGSSPRMRGALCSCVLSDSGRRIIPADAGSTHV